MDDQGDAAGRTADDRLEHNWHLALRAAGVSSAVTAALGASLHRFAGVSATVIVVGAAAVAVTVGWRLPAASPRRAARAGHERLPV